MTDKMQWTGCLTISYLLKIYANDKVSARRIALENKEKFPKQSRNQIRIVIPIASIWTQMKLKLVIVLRILVNKLQEKPALVLELLLVITK